MPSYANSLLRFAGYPSQLAKPAPPRMKPYRGPPMTLGKRLEAGETVREIARDYNVSQSTISRLT